MGTPNEVVYTNRVGRSIPVDYVRLHNEKMGFFRIWGLMLKIFLWDFLLASKGGFLGWVIKLTMPVGYLFLIVYGKIEFFMGAFVLGTFVSILLVNNSSKHNWFLILYWAYFFWMFIIASPVLSVWYWIMINRDNSYDIEKSWKASSPEDIRKPRCGNYIYR